MNTKRDPREIATSILNRSSCAVQVGACVADSRGVFAWGWNSAGDGFGKHAEDHCLERANSKRLNGATMYVAAQRKRNKKIVTAHPCWPCLLGIQFYEVGDVWYRDKDGLWRLM